MEATLYLLTTIHSYSQFSALCLIPIDSALCFYFLSVSFSLSVTVTPSSRLSSFQFPSHPILP